MKGELAEGMEKGRNTGVKSGRITLGAVLVLAVVMFFSVAAADGREIADMRGRTVKVPDTITRVYSSSPPVTFLLAAVDPTLLVGLNFPIAEGGAAYLPKSMHKLPVLGGFFGRGQTANIEMVLKAKPDIILTGGFRNSALNNKYEESLKTLGIRMVYVDFESLKDYPDALVFLGKVLKREERTKRLADYAKEVLADTERRVRAIPADRRPTVYYAEDMDGLSTECTGSPHAELIDLVGARNVHRCAPRDTMGMEAINIEKVVLYDPEVILVKERVFYNKIFRDPGWRKIKAVRNGRVYLIPGIPFNWFDRPPSFMRFLGIQWLMSCLYPNDYKKDLVGEAQEFYRLFLGVNPTREQIGKVVNP